MRNHGKYPGLRAGSYGEQAVDIVIAAQSIEGPALAARLGISVYEMGCLKRAVALGYLKKCKGDVCNKNIYSPGPNVPAAGQTQKSLVQVLLEHIAEKGSLTSRALGEICDMPAGAVSGSLSQHTKNGVVKVRKVWTDVEGTPRQISEFYGANLQRYLENFARPGDRPAPPPVDKAALNIVPPRTAPEFRPLKATRIGPALYREGALDFRDIPSVYARKACA